MFGGRVHPLFVIVCGITLLGGGLGCGGGAGPSMTSTAGQSVVPLTLPSSCSPSQARPVVSGFGEAAGTGPLYAALGDAGGEVAYEPAAREADYYRIKVLFFSRESWNGRGIVRGGEIGNPANRLAFGQPTALTLHLSHEGGPPSNQGWPTTVLFKSPGCYALQLDTGGGSETVTFRLHPTGGT